MHLKCIKIVYLKTFGQKYLQYFFNTQKYLKTVSNTANSAYEIIELFFTFKNFKTMKSSAILFIRHWNAYFRLLQIEILLIINYCNICFEYLIYITLCKCIYT